MKWPKKLGICALVVLIAAIFLNAAWAEEINKDGTQTAPVEITPDMYAKQYKRGNLGIDGGWAWYRLSSSEEGVFYLSFTTDSK